MTRSLLESDRSRYEESKNPTSAMISCNDEFRPMRGNRKTVCIGLSYDMYRHPKTYTRSVPNGKAYNRKKEKERISKEFRDGFGADSFLLGSKSVFTNSKITYIFLLI